jgi:hypothetical protein
MRHKNRKIKKKQTNNTYTIIKEQKTFKTKLKKFQQHLYNH